MSRLVARAIRHGLGIATAVAAAPVLPVGYLMLRVVPFRMWGAAEKVLNARSPFYRSIGPAAMAIYDLPVVGPRLRNQYRQAKLREAQRISAPPGSRLNRLAESVYSARTYAHVLQPVLADMQAEHFDALHQGRTIKARWVQCRGYYRFWSHVVAQLPVSGLRAAVKLWYSIP